MNRFRSHKTDAVFHISAGSIATDEGSSMSPIGPKATPRPRARTTPLRSAAASCACPAPTLTLRTELTRAAAVFRAIHCCTASLLLDKCSQSRVADREDVGAARVEDALDLRGELLQSVLLLGRIIVLVVDAFDTSDDVAEHALSGEPRDASAHHQCLC